jgi:hypothetical protein
MPSPQTARTAEIGRVSRFVRRPGTACAAVGTLAVAVRLLLLPLLPIPTPSVHDEFSYLLGADTFASGRIANPPHPMWVHFETFHVNQLPAYASKYPPAQSLFLAFGQKLLGHPWFGVCLSMGLMFASLCWMLQGWVAPAYAVPITVMAVLQWGLGGYWMNSYWGGAVAAMGGALVIGAIPRLARRISVAPALLGSLGLAVVANSRPYEGTVLAVAAAAVLLWRMRRSGRPVSALLCRRAVLPFLLVMVPCGAAMAYYNYRLTGSATLFPYTLNQRTYAASPHIYLLPPIAEPVYRHENIRWLWAVWDRDKYLRARAHPFQTMEVSLGLIERFYLENPLAIPALLGLAAGGSVEMAMALAIALPVLFSLLVAKSVLPHYYAPAFGALLLLSAAGLQAIERRLPRIRRAGVLLGLLCLGVTFGSSLAGVLEAHGSSRQPPLGVELRPQVIRRLERQGGRHLVIVRYSASHDIHQEWVYNAADIDASPIVWAQDMGEEKNRELVQYYAGRRIWLLQPDVDPLALTPYAAAGNVPLQGR